jgi:signal-transduction protein with cAMP-binding, CBS, and nucleotidyltransferase domain
MFVEEILPRARERLAVIEANAAIGDAARLLMRPHTDLIVVCESGVAAGVVSKSDVLTQVGGADISSALAAPVSTIMTREVLSCLASDHLLDVLTTTKERGLQRVPVLAETRAPLGVVYMRDALQALLNESKIEDEFLRNYIQGLGYH